MLLLSSAALYVIQPFARRAVLMSLPMHQVERLEATLDPDTEAGGVLAIFLNPSEAHRLAIPSCLQYALTPDASYHLVAMHEQLVLALSTWEASEWEVPAGEADGALEL